MYRLTVVFLLTLLFSPIMMHAQTIIGTGYSTDPDMLVGAENAAKQAKAELKGASPKLVLVADGYRGDKQAMLDRVAKVFPKQTIYGGMSFGAICSKGYAKGNSIAIVAIADPKLKLLTARADGVKADMRQAGVKIAQNLGCSATTNASLLLIGDCHVPTDQTLVEGVQSVLGNSLQIYGGSTSFEADSYYQGVARRDSAFGIAILGSSASTLLAGGSTNADEVISLACKSAAKALASNSRAKMLMLFECAGRQGLLTYCDAERLAMVSVNKKSLPVFGFYGSGEIGQPENGTRCEGRGVHVCAASVGW